MNATSDEMSGNRLLKTLVVVMVTDTYSLDEKRAFRIISIENLRIDTCPFQFHMLKIIQSLNAILILCRILNAGQAARSSFA